MIKFVNAKINIGLQIVSRRSDGYHNLQTVFYPVGLYAGTPENPVEFCDVLEIITVEQDEQITLELTGNKVDCPIEKNLVWKAAQLFFEAGAPEGFKVKISLDKHLPDGAGLGGGSADASFTLLMLVELAERYAREKGLQWKAPEKKQLLDMAFSLGADCPFFIYNSPAYGEGAGEKLTPVNLDLAGHWLLIAKPFASVSTKEAFSGIAVCPDVPDLRKIVNESPGKWGETVKNDFENTIFAKHPEIGEIKDKMYGLGALYASLTGSGACVYGIFKDRGTAQKAQMEMQHNPTIKALSLLKL